MAKKKQLDKLSLDMIQCKRDGFGVHYGAWKATQVPVKTEEPPLPDDWRICAWCGKPFKLKTKRNKIYCECFCQIEAQRERDREKHAQYIRDYRERKAINESNA